MNRSSDHGAYWRRDRVVAVEVGEGVVRVVLTGLPVYSHLVPMVVPVARVLAAAGHDVAVATGSAMAEELERHGVTHLPLPRMLGPGQFGRDPEFARSIGLSPEGVALPQPEPLPPGEAFGRLFAGLGAVRTAEDLLAAAADWRPDLVVRECTESVGIWWPSASASPASRSR